MSTSSCNTKRKFLLAERLNSFTHAFNGIKALIRSEHNMWIHLCAGFAAIVAGFLHHISTIKWIAIVICIGMVWITEAVNTAIEKLCDFACKGEFQPAIKTVKDISAGAVLIAACISVIVAVLVFII